MREPAKDPCTEADPTEEIHPMPKRLTSLAALIASALLLLIPASASAASPWWQVSTASHPTNLWVPADSEWEVETDLGEFFGEPALIAEVEVGGQVVGCLGVQSEIGNLACEFNTGFPATETAEQLEALLKSAFGTEAVEATGGPVGGEPFKITAAGAVPGIKLVTCLSPPCKEGEGEIGSAELRIISPGGSGRLVLALTNLGNAPVDATENPLTITDELPEGVIAAGAEGFAGVFDFSGPVDCGVETASLVSCSFEGTLPPYEAIEIEIPASLTGEPPAAGAPGKVSVSGGNAPAASAVQEIEVSPEKTPFGFERFSTKFEEEGGGSVIQAGSHPFQLASTIQLNTGKLTVEPGRSEASIEQTALPRNFRFSLPAGLVGNATAVPRCEMQTFYQVKPKDNCSPEAAVGVASVTVIEQANLGLNRFAAPVFNLPPAWGEPARFGFKVMGAPIVVDTAVDPDDEYRITAEIRNATQLTDFLSGTVVLWGSPGDPRHDSSRGWPCVNRFLEEKAALGPCERPDGLGQVPLLRQPVSCVAPLEFGAEVEPWNVPLGSVVEKASSVNSKMFGCNKVPFDPTIAAAPTSKLAENPSGLSFRLTMPNSGLLNPEAIAEGQPKRVEVTLPEGMTLNPSAAEGLAVCTPADYARERSDSTPGEGCPDASKLGNVAVDTPLIEEDVLGSLYIAKSYENPFNSLLALYIVARSPERGVLIKLPIKVSPDPKTGQLIAMVDDAPQAPFTSFDLSFREGGRSPLVTPPACGSYEVKARFIPWSAKDPDNPTPSEVVTRTSSFQVQRGVDGGACPPGGVPPFKPDFQAGSINNDAGSHTPFNMRLLRKDGEQDMTRFSAVLPPGVVGKLAGVDLCPASAVAVAEAKTGLEEIANPSCPANSEIGHSLVGAGVGSVLSWVKGKVYMGGALKGSPLSVIAITPVVAGPFDVGTVVVQEALTLNPKTAEVEVDGEASDPIPHILQGIPTKLRDLRVYVDRPDFILNPTSCEESSARSTLFGSYLDVLSSTDDKPVDLATRFQAANCANLGFKPSLKLNLKGGTKRGGHPGLKATYKPRKGDANVKGLVVRLPSSAFLDQAHIRTICTRVQFASDNCPAAAQYGYIKAWTPLLDEPLQGPVWLRSSNHKLPDLIFDLHGIVDVEVATRIDSQRGGIRATVESAPDAPLSKVELRMQGGKKGLIINSRNLCGSTSKANVQFAGHNGKEATAKPVMRADGCGGKRKR